jgi:hypothetical protein
MTSKLSPADVSAAAATLNTTPAKVWAIADVESAGDGFDGVFPVIRFEPHWFQKLTKGKYDKSHPRLSHSYAQRKSYAQPASQAERRRIQFAAAMALDPNAAIQATSFGLFQMMGFNYRVCGFKSPADFHAAMCRSEGAQLQATVGFIKSLHLDDELQRGDWAGFAKVYNGPAYADAPGRSADYDYKLDQAHKRRSAR